MVAGVGVAKGSGTSWPRHKTGPRRDLMHLMRGHGTPWWTLPGPLTTQRLLRQRPCNRQGVWIRPALRPSLVDWMVMMGAGIRQGMITQGTALAAEAVENSGLGLSSPPDTVRSAWQQESLR